MKIHIFIILSILFFAGCKKQITEPSKDLDGRTDSVTLNIFGIVNQDSLFADRAEVKVDTFTIYETDDYGKCIIWNLRKGEHNIQITHSYFFALDTNINISPSRVLNISLLAKVADFLPFHIGNTWVYRLHSYQYYYEQSNTDTYGIIVLKLDSINYINGNKYFLTEQRIDTTFQSNRARTKIDTTYNQSSGSFSLIPQEAHQLRALDFMGTVTFGYYSSGGLYSRYIPDTTDELSYSGGIFGGPYTNYLLRKNVGVIRYSYGTSDFHTANSSGVLYELVSYEFKK